MSTKHFKDKDNNLFGIVIHEENAETWQSEIQEDWIEITIEEAQVIANPPPTQAQIDEQQEAENIMFLASESERSEVAIKKLQRVIDRNIATEEEAQKFDELEIYSIKLMRVPNQNEWPLNPEWPECPEFFKQ